ncbi:hypothetical protein EDD22DRAFT_78480 [Suillus occidentalis]|nr:hypothetical protein EDD22DRAFT_78480 [Suillus occidentalis]
MSTRKQAPPDKQVTRLVPSNVTCDHNFFCAQWARTVTCPRVYSTPFSDASAHSVTVSCLAYLPQDGPCFIRVIEGAVTPRACTARPKGVHNSSIHARLQQEQPKIALEIGFRHRQRLTLSWCSSSRVRNTGLQIKIYFDDFLFMLEVAPQY